MAYIHGIYVEEQATAVPAPSYSDSGVQVVFGAAPVNMADDPTASTNVPVLCKTYDEALAAIGYSEKCDWMAYTLCQAIYASFVMAAVSPVVFVNVLDPAKHKTSVAQAEFAVVAKKCTIEVFGILKSSVVVKSSADGTALTLGTDYELAFDSNGYLLITLLSSGSAASAAKIYVAYDKIDASLVKAADVIGGVDATTKALTGLELIKSVYPKFGINAGLISAPVWSKDPTVAAVMQTKCDEINGCFTSECVVDIDSTSTGATNYSMVAAAKTALGVTGAHTICVWPCVKKDGHIIMGSAAYSAEAKAVDAANEDIPYNSASNKEIDIDAVCLADGTEVMLDFEDGNELNADGIVTALNQRGFRFWGNNTAAYPGSTDPKDRWISVRRFFTYQDNRFINSYLDKVDNPASMRMIESIIDAENVVCNGFVARGYCAGASIKLDSANTDLVNGKVAVIQTFTPYPPLEAIVNSISFDVSQLTAVLNGGE